jgi:tRNA (guanine37-N1)-methyltransferase
VRIDVVTIFPAFFDVLEVSLLGRARDAGILDVRVHDLRDFTHDRHRTVDDTPYGGGAGMVMKPEPWGRRWTPSPQTPPSRFGSSSLARGAVFTQAAARSWAASGEHLVFGCGRYEGIDERVFSYAATLGEVSLTSIGDYVLNGGEVAAMAMIEAVGRLIPGVVGNPESLIEESHEDGLLEYPSFTKPAAWRGYDVPDVCSRAITAVSPTGAESSRSSAPARDGRIFSRTDRVPTGGRAAGGLSRRRGTSDR